MSGMGDGDVGTAQDAVRIRRLEKQREAERHKIQELKTKSASAKGQLGLLQFGSSASEILETAFKKETVGLVTREQYVEKKKPIHAYHNAIDRVTQNQNPRSARLRLFLFPEGEDSRTSSITSLLNGSAKRENWFLDALNGGVSGLKRGRSEAFSMVSKVPDYLFGLDNSDDTHQRDPRPKDRPVLQDNVSVSDSGSPAPVVSSPYCFTSSAPCVPSLLNLPSAKTKLSNSVADSDSKENQMEPETEPQPNLNLNLYPSNPVVHYPQESAYSVRFNRELCRLICSRHLTPTFNNHTMQCGSRRFETTHVSCRAKFRPGSRTPDDAHDRC
ncbi:Protein XAP5 CIRCADIAN [Vigna angularis]|uniref:Protein XAP5 CIRCADIAN n=1 Tax=Phaseolus angularis TaxID=3914 RepID=A0A8T0LJJ1_PHAAN|nr:Protein XAP5 CIRCADIAN [Vigna angularis]